MKDFGPWLENCFWATAFILIVLLVPGWGKAWAIAPLLMVNYKPKSK